MSFFSVSNIGLPAHDHTDLFPALCEMGFSGIEVAPSRVWVNTWEGLRASDVEVYRRHIEDAGLRVVGLHSLFFDQPELTIFGDDETRTRAVAFLAHLSGVCRDLGGGTLVFGSPSARRRGTMAVSDAMETARRTFEDLARMTEGHGTVFCLEPLGPEETDFCNTIAEISQLYAQINADNLKFQLDVRALSVNREVSQDVVDGIAPNLAHVHVNAADLGGLRMDDGVEHEKIGRLLKDAGYSGALSLEQRTIDERDHLGPIRNSMEIMKAFYT